MTNRAEIEALGLYIYEHRPVAGGDPNGWSVQPGVVKTGACPVLKVSIEPGETEENALGRLLTLAQAELG